MITITMSQEAHDLICGLVHPSEEIDSEGVVAPAEVWNEVRATFPLIEYKYATKAGVLPPCRHHE